MHHQALPTHFKNVYVECSYKCTPTPKRADVFERHITLPDCSVISLLGSSASKISHPYRTCHNNFFYYIQQNYLKNVKYDILRAVTMKITVSWEAASCSLLFYIYIYIPMFSGMCYFIFSAREPTKLHATVE
jgi:hypothetical protein